jgi:beta-galactosidase
MTTQSRLLTVLTVGMLVLIAGLPARGQADAALPEGVKAVWDLGKAWRETTPTRERVCINGLWRWQPAAADASAVPAEGWGYFKVPGCWPGITDYMQKDSQTVFAHPSWKDQKFAGVTAAWYQREIEIPAEWRGRRVTLALEYLNSFATVYVDGAKAGEARFPAGEVDLTDACKPGTKHLVSIHVIAMPLKGVMMSYADSATAREVKGKVDRRGLCGDAYLVATPAGAGLGDVKVETSVRRGELSVSAAVRGMRPEARYAVRVTVLKDGKAVTEFTGRAFTAGDLKDGRVTVKQAWSPAERWDLNTPQNVFDLKAALVDAGSGAVVDAAWPVRFGFRELWIDGRDFYLNGSRLFLSAVPLDNAQIGAAAATYPAARETFRRLKAIGINFVYTHNYDCTPGAHLGFEEVLRAADDEGVLVALTQPHFAQYDWKAPNADAENGYARDAAFYVRVAQNHPSVVFYAMSHNACGYDEDMNPGMIDGHTDPRDQWSSRNANLALRAEAIVRRLDPSRIVYHHAGGNIGAMWTANFYPNFAPTQELSDWFGHWASAGTKPAFLCEYGAPFAWDWTMYRGWYKGQREFGSAAVPWEFCLAEWDAQFLGDRAYAIGDLERANLRWEAAQFRAGKVWHRWDYPTEVGSPKFADRNEVLAAYIRDNWRAYRTWGVSGISPWEYGMYWTARPGVDRSRKQLPVAWEELQRPGFSPDYVERPMERMDVAFEQGDWTPTAAGEALIRNNQPVLAYVADGGESFTGRGHNFRAGEAVEKQLVIVNNSRRTLPFACEWSLGISPAVSGRRDLSVESGQIARVPLHFDLPAAVAAGRYELSAKVRFGERQEQSDTFAMHVLPPARPVGASVLLFDPVGETAKLLDALGVSYRRIEADAKPGAGDVVVIGKHALSGDGAAPDLSAVRDGARVVVFEQKTEVLERRLGFRVVEYGLRQVFPRIPDHPLLAGLTAEHLHNWRGAATTVPPTLVYERVPRHGPTVRWCDIPVSHVWRCGNRGDVASVLVEKPARGDFRPVLDGGFDLQYSPLMEYHEGKGLVLFCQMDVTGRSQGDPAAEALAANVIAYASAWKAPPVRQAVYVGEAKGMEHLKSAGIEAGGYEGGELSPREDVLVIGPGGGSTLAPHAAAVGKFIKGGGNVVAVGLDQRDADAALPFKVTLAKREHVGTTFDAPGLRSSLAGVGPADVHVREPREVPLLTSGAAVLGDGVLGTTATGAGDSTGFAVFCQLVPWQFDPGSTPNVKRTFRRASCMLTRVLANQGVSGTTAVLDHLHRPIDPARAEKRWLDGLYPDAPEEWDNPYRFFRW